MLKRVHHVAIVVPKLEAAFSFWRDLLGLTVTRSATLENQGVRAALLRLGDGEIELLEPLDPANGVGRFLARTGGGLHHICFETDDIAAEMADARTRGVQLIDESPRAGLAGMVCLLHPKATHGVLIEYAEPREI
jgi:methylmalonyl-CoA/ethylmalonyl-CoA epimerase